LQNEEHHHRESQLPQAGEILRVGSVSGNELRVAQLATQRFDELKQKFQSILAHKTS
jgi:hypothetical protein